MSSRKKRKNNEKLYFLLKDLSNYVDNQDELGEVIGYSVISSLTDFRSNSGSEQELKFEQVKEVYKTLSSLVEKYHTDKTYYALGSLRRDIDPLLEKICQNYSDSKNTKYLINKILPELIESKRHYEDILRRAGKKIYDNVFSVGYLERNIDTLKNDFRSLEDAFDF